MSQFPLTPLKIMRLLCFFLIFSIVQSAEVNHYEVLGVSKDATQQEIRSAYKKLSLKYHPDKNAGSQEADEKFAAIAAAYDILGDADKRAVYDNFGSKTYTDKQEAEKHSPGKMQQSFYESSSSVHALSNWMFDGWTFQGERAKGPLAKIKTWMIEFYAPWCVHCQNMVSAWKKAASILEGEIGFGAVNCEAEPTLCRKWNIHSYPTITYVSQDEATEMVYSGEHTVEAFVSFARSMSSDAVVTVRPNEFEATILQSSRPSMVLFNAGSWCGPCQNAKTRWRMFASKVSSDVTVATVDCDKYRDFCNELNVSAYPHVRGFGGASGSFGGNLGEELFQMRFGLETSLEIIEKTILMMARNHGSSGHDEL